MIVKPAKRVDGLIETVANLRQVPEIVKEGLRPLIRRWSGTTLRLAQARAPRGETGDLANSYGENVRDDELQAAVGSSLHRAKFTELGTSKAPAQPHLYPGFRAANREFRADMPRLLESVKVRARVRRLKKPKKRA